jgi:hypothetical protein
LPKREIKFRKTTFAIVGSFRALPAYREDRDRLRLFLLQIFRHVARPLISSNGRPGKLHSASENRNCPPTLQS